MPSDKSFPSHESVPPFAFPFSSSALSELLSLLLLLLMPAGFFTVGDLATGVDEDFGFFLLTLELFCASFFAFKPATGVPAGFSFSASSLELSEELLVLLAATPFFFNGALALPAGLLADFIAGFFRSSSLLELSESELLALGPGVQGLDPGLAAFPAGLVGGAFFSSSELLSESELLCAFFATAGDFLDAGGTGLTAGFAGASSSELSESRREASSEKPQQLSRAGSTRPTRQERYLT